jgi:hypothetical protein
MGGGTSTSTQSTSSNVPGLNTTLTKLLTSGNNSVSGIFDKGPQVFNQSLYAGTGPTTTNAWAQGLAAANNPTFNSGVQGALTNQANIAAGNGVGINDPAFQTMRDKLSSDVLGQVGSQFTNSGRFGGGSYINDATNDLTSSLGSLDYQQYLNGQQQQQQAIQNLPGLYSDLQLPSSTAGAIGSAQDTDAQNKLSAQADLFNRQNNGGIDLLSKLSGILNGTAQAGGTTTTSTQPSTPWWQSALGLGIGLL